jgi:hypothetical protein
MKSNNILIVFLVLTGLLACDTAFETDLAGKKVILLAPANNLSTTDRTHTFYWEQLQGAAEYRLQVVSPRFDSIVKLIADTTISFDRFKLTNLDAASYQWRVQALNNSSTSDQGDTWNLKIQ